jgi:hypothetical protein
MGIIKREGSEWVSSKGKKQTGLTKREVENGYHQKGRK